VSNSQFIDHQLLSSELLASYVSNSTQLLKPGISQYGNTTSDHYPVRSRFEFGLGTPPLLLLSPNGGEQLSASTVRTITWMANGVSTVKLEYSQDDGATWQVLTSSVPAASGQYTWTVPRSRRRRGACG